MSTVALVLALAILATGIAAAVIVRLLPTLRLQLVAVALLAVNWFAFSITARYAGIASVKCPCPRKESACS